jgi:hypothetical protein
LAAFIINIAESNFRHAQRPMSESGTNAKSFHVRSVAALGA